MCQVISLLSVLFLLCLVFFPEASQAMAFPSAAEDCVNGTTSDYRGTRNHTMSGLLCQRWNESFPHESFYTLIDGSKHNYCRNPNGDIFGTWCYTTDPNVTWEYCRIPKCKPHTPIVLLMTSARTKSTYISRLSPEPVYPQPSLLDAGETLYTISYYNVFSAIAADVKNSKLFFSDYSQKCLSTFDLETGKVTNSWTGMAKDIDQFAFDWVSRNLYWTDAVTGFLVVADANLQYYTNLDIPTGLAYGVAIHMKRRELYFGLRSRGRGFLVSTDLAGKNPRYLSISIHTKTFPNIAIDYSEDRVYWIDNQYRINYVRSCKLDGSDQRNVGSSMLATFRSLAIYQETVYTSDVRGYGGLGEAKGKFWLFSKDGKQRTIYEMDVFPRGLLLYGEHQEMPVDELPSIGECHTEPTCGHICLPRFNATRECVCMLGFHKIGDTGCVLNIVEDPYLLVADNAQKKIFQISLNAPKGVPFSVLPISTEYEQKVVTMAINIRTETMYWSDGHNNKIYKSHNGSEPVVIKEGYHARRLAVDHVTGNVYFSDANTGFIHVMNDDGSHLKTILKPVEDVHKKSFVQSIALDLKFGHLYWSDHVGLHGKGHVRRIRLDGTSPEVVFEDVMVPRALTIARERQSLIMIVEGNRIHEVPLSDLQDLESNRPKLVKPIPLRVTSEFKEINDILVDNYTLYIVDEYHSSIRKYDLNDLQYVALVGKHMLYKPMTLASYRSSLIELYLDNLPNPCARRQEPCSQLCFFTSQTTSRCDCEDGWAVDDVKCRDTNVTLDTPPSYGTSCPDNFQVVLKPCQNTTNLTWVTPQWEDDVTATSDLIITSPTIKNEYPAGRYEFLYTATDKGENIGHCRFIITVSATVCPFAANLYHEGIVATQPICEGGEYVHYLQCAEADHYFRGSLNNTIKNVCRINGMWSVPRPKPCINPSPSTTTGIPDTTDDPSSSNSHTKINLALILVVPIVSVVLLAVGIFFIVSKYHTRKSFAKATRQVFGRVLWSKDTNSQSEESLHRNAYCVFK